MIKEKYCLYVHTNLINNKKYVGVTKREPRKRWDNGHGYYSNKEFYNDILKYGWDNFTHEILLENLSKDEASEMERKYIKEYSSNKKKYGYNHTTGGLDYIPKPKENILDIFDDDTIKFPNYDIVKENKLFYGLLKECVRNALGHHNKIVTEIYHYSDGLLLDKSSESKLIYVKPNINSINLLIRSYGHEEKLKRLIHKCERAKKYLEGYKKEAE